MCPIKVNMIKYQDDNNNQFYNKRKDETNDEQPNFIFAT